MESSKGKEFTVRIVLILVSSPLIYCIAFCLIEYASLEWSKVGFLKMIHQLFYERSVLEGRRKYYFVGVEGLDGGNCSEVGHPFYDLSDLDLACFRVVEGESDLI